MTPGHSLNDIQKSPHSDATVGVMYGLAEDQVVSGELSWKPVHVAELVLQRALDVGGDLRDRYVFSHDAPTSALR